MRYGISNKIKLSPSNALRVLAIGFILGVFIGGFVYSKSIPNSDSLLFASGEGDVIGTVSKIQESNSGEKLTLHDVSFEGEEKSSLLIAYIPAFSNIVIGDIVSFSCDLKSPEPIEKFRYDRFLAAKNIYKICYLKYVPVKVGTSAKKYPFAFLNARSVNKIQKLFPGVHGTLLSGLLFGANDFRPAWKDRFMKTGISHIVAASGYNVTLVANSIFVLLIGIGLYRRQSFIFVCLGIIFYAIFAGAEASVLRAGVMGILVLLAKQVGRKTTMMNVLLMTVVIMLILNPRLLRDDVGFQLSVVSASALIYLSPILQKYAKWIPETFALRESCVTTFSATLCALPILLLRFHTFSAVSLVANVLILPLIPFAMAFGFAALLSTYVSSFVASGFSIVTWALLSHMLFIADILSHVPVLPIAQIVAVILSLCLVGFLFYIWRKEQYFQLSRRFA